MHKLRTVVEEELVKARIQAAAKKHPHLKEMWERGIIWLLAHHAEIGTKIPGTERYVFSIPVWTPRQLPRISVTYQITENEVIIEASRIDENWPPKKGSR